MRVLCVLLPVVLAVACARAPEYERQIIAACGAIDYDYGAAVDRARHGDVEAIDCLITSSDALRLNSYSSPDPTHSVVWRYLRWITTGEEPDRIFEHAVLAERSRLERRLSAEYLGYLEAHGVPVSGDYSADYVVRFTDAGCFIRPPKMDRLWRAAQPDGDSARCVQATRPHPSH